VAGALENLSSPTVQNHLTPVAASEVPQRERTLTKQRDWKSSFRSFFTPCSFWSLQFRLALVPFTWVPWLLDPFVSKSIDLVLRTVDKPTVNSDGICDAKLAKDFLGVIGTVDC
jgi:hypothetical protein